MSDQTRQIEIATDEIAALRAIVEGTARATGEEFFQSLVKNLATAIDAQYAFVAEFADVNTHARTIAFWAKDRFHDNLEWELAGTPCEDVVRGELCHHPHGISQQFPNDRPMVEWGIDSYLGVPLKDTDGNVLGHLAVFDERPMSEEPRRLFIFRIFAARAAAELHRLHMVQHVEESERRYRDLYEEAPIAYLSTGVDGRLRSVNHRATEWLGYTADELIGRTVADFFADTPDGKPHGAAAFQKFIKGQEVVGEEIELRRKDGSPLWVSLWLKPILRDDGTVEASRSIWIDITDRVLAEKESARLRLESQYLQEEIKAGRNFEEIIGRSPALAAVLEQVRAVGPTDATVLVTGETGTGKELMARAIHSISKRHDKPLIKVNCAALPAGLVESELFGHEKGAFTGAISQRVGKFELAHGGTIFLDEIGELPLEMQSKLLRVLQEHELDRVGGSTPIRVDVRVIAATNRDLAVEVRERRFREDLYYRLNVFPLQFPPLRERAGDVPLLAYYFMGRFASQLGKRIEGIAAATMERLVAYHWPGNIRELENVIERAVILCHGDMLEIEPKLLECSPVLPRPGMSDAEERASEIAADTADKASLETVERNHILAVLEQTAWRIDGPRGAAQILDMHPNTLRSRLKKLGISRPT